MVDRRTKDRRRREYAQRLPGHYCAECSFVVYPEDENCLECETPRPDEGWATIQDGFDPWIGRMLDGRYLITGRIGQGAAGTVYRADSIAISRDFAIKIINFKQAPAGVEPEQIRARLHREIEAISRLRNPHVVPFYEVLELYDHFVGIVMDFVYGETLEALVRRQNGIPMKRAAKALRQICNGVHEAHEAGMIHRDLKPDNIMIERMPAGDDFVHILDFGIVRMDDGVSMTQGFLGTPLYASPEQAMAGEVDRRSDIYSLGAIFFFLLTGRPPFISDNVYELLRAHVRTAPPKISEVAPNRRFPNALVALVDSMLAKSPTGRPQHLGVVIELLDELIASRQLDLNDDPSSIEFFIGEGSEMETGPQDPVNTDVLPGLGEVSESEFHRDLSEQSDSFVVSRSRDQTGPKAAIFRRTPSRNNLREVVEETRRTLQSVKFDRVLSSDSGVFDIGVGGTGKITMSDASTSGAIAMVNERNDVFMRATADSSPRRVYEGDGAEVLAVAVLSATEAVIGLNDGTILKVADGEEPQRLYQDVHRKPLTALDSDGEGKAMIAGTESGRVFICRRERGDDHWSRVLDGPPVAALAMSPNGNFFAVGRKHKEVELYNIGSPKTPFARFTTLEQIRTLEFSTDNQLLAVLTEDSTVALHLAITGQRMVHLKDSLHPLISITFNMKNELIGYFPSSEGLKGLDIQRELKAVKG